MNQRKSDCRRSGLASSTSDTVHCRSASECMLMSSSTDKNGNATTIRHNQADDEKSKLFVAAKNNVTVRTVLLPICCSISLFCVVFCVWRTIRLEMRIANLEQQLDSVEHIAKFSLTNVEYERLRLLIGNNALNSTLYFESTSRSPRSATTIKRCVCPPGPAGPPGLQGEKGDVGPIGLPGNPGSPAKPLQGSKLFPDSLHFLLADKSLNDEQDDKVIDSRWSTSHFIKGEPGANGTPGQPGPPGQPGLPGPPGNDGRPGFDGMIKIGDKGEIGLPGPAGKPGGEGPIGAPGEKGDKGDKGSLTTLFNGKATVIECLPGPQGPPGPKGDKGDAGLIGLPGEKGKRGRRGKGEKGDKGISGEKGSVCEPSPPGEKGERGERGKTGVRGKHGNKGDKGDQGIPGLDAPCPLAPDGLPLPGCGWKPIKNVKSQYGFNLKMTTDYTNQK